MSEIRSAQVPKIFEKGVILKGDLYKLHSKKVILLGKNDVFS
jgi:hypothetical protein